MRKKNPNDVIDDFKELVSTSLDTWTSMCGQITGNELRKNASTDAFLNAAIGWESFLSDWHIASINRDSAAFVKDLELRVGESLAGRGWGALQSRVALSLPKHPSLDLVQELLDPTGANIAFGDKDKWLARAQRELRDPYKSRVTALSDRDHRLIRAVTGIRDCIAHRSRRASDSMNEALASLTGGDAALQRAQTRVQPSGVGAYLYAQTARGRRVRIYHERLAEIAEALRVQTA